MRKLSVLGFIALLTFLGLSTQTDRPTLFLIGDSTMADKPLEDNPERGWGQLLPDFFATTLRIENHARNGRSTGSFIREGRWDTVMSRLKAGDFVIIQFGHNDQSKEKGDRYTPPEAFAENLRRFVRDTRSRDAIPILCTPVMRRRFDSEGKFYDVHGTYPDLVRGVSKEIDVPLIDMHRLSEKAIVAHGVEGSKRIFLWIPAGAYASIPDGKTDNTHFSAYGARLMAHLAVQEMQYLGIPLTSHLLRGQ